MPLAKVEYPCFPWIGSNEMLEIPASFVKKIVDNWHIESFFLNIKNFSKESEKGSVVVVLFRGGRTA